MPVSAGAAAPVLGFFDGGTRRLWLTQDGMAWILALSTKTTNEHLGRVRAKFPDTAVRRVRVATANGRRYVKEHYGLETFFQVAMRAKSAPAKRYRKIAAAKIAQLIMTGRATADAEWLDLLADLFRGGVVHDLDPADEVVEPALIPAVA